MVTFGLDAFGFNEDVVNSVKTSKTAGHWVEIAHSNSSVLPDTLLFAG